LDYDYIITRAGIILIHIRKEFRYCIIALQKADVSRDEYVFWQDNIEFKRRLDLISDTSVDYVENKLLALINKNDLSAIQFYLKTKGKKRGY